MEKNIGKLANDAAKALNDFHKALYQCCNSEYNELKKVCDPFDLEKNEEFFFMVPDEYNQEFINLVKVGCSIKQAYEIIKETYEF